jgi:hypothetical protein
MQLRLMQAQLWTVTSDGCTGCRQMYSSMPGESVLSHRAVAVGCVLLQAIRLTMCESIRRIMLLDKYSSVPSQAGADRFDSQVYLANRLENKINMSESKTRNYSGEHSRCRAFGFRVRRNTNGCSSLLRQKQTLAGTVSTAAHRAKRPACLPLCPLAAAACNALVQFSVQLHTRSDSHGSMGFTMCAA